MGALDLYRDVLFVDIDRFKSLNSSLGHAGGDWLLVEVAAPLQAAALAERLTKVVGAPFVFDGRQVTATLSIGIAFAPATVRIFPISAPESQAAVDELRNRAAQ